MTKLQQTKQNELTGKYLNEKELIRDTKQAITVDFNYSDILSERIVIKAYSDTLLTSNEVLSKVEDICNVISLVKGA